MGDIVRTFDPLNRPSAPFRLVCLFQCLVSLYLLVHVCFSLEAPLHPDEVREAVRSQKEVPLFDKLACVYRNIPVSQCPNPNQYIAVIATHLSYKWFGLSVRSTHYPPILFTLILLIALFFLCKNFGVFATFFLYLHLAVNFSVQEYLHLSKGYVSLMAFSTVLLCLVLRYLNQILKPIHFVSLLLFFCLCAFSHTTGAFFSLILVGLLLFHSDGNHRRKMMWLGTLVCPIALWMIFSHLQYLQAIRSIGHDTLPSTSLKEVFGVFGIQNPLAGLLTLLFLGVLLLISLKQPSLRTQFITQFSFLTIGLTVVLVFLLKPHILQIRYFLVFLIPVLLWMGVQVSRFRIPRVRYLFATTALLLFVLQPACDSRKMQEHYQAHHTKEFQIRTKKAFRITGSRQN